jgi:nanoRNase/pAp phosphatase (c-di-AMP/oligoRNAs hydrolase)
VSLRSRVGCDIGTIARRLEGGGHRVAAGYTSKQGSVDEAISELKEEVIASRRDTGCR